MFYIRYIKMIMQTLPLLGAADSETGRHFLGGSGRGKSIPRRTTYHRTSLPEFFVDGNTYIFGPIFVVPNLVSGGC